MKKNLLYIVGLCLIFSCSKKASEISDFEKKGLDLVERWYPGKSIHFSFQKLDTTTNGTFKISKRNDKIFIEGSNGIAIASGFHWYLKKYCNAQIDINGHATPLPDILPLPEEEISSTTTFEYRNFFNYCTFGYTMPWWNWNRWEKIIDWMAMNGVNMPLAITGQEAVWQQLLAEQGLNQKEIESFLVGPAFLPWGWMGNIDGMAGPMPQNWIDSHVKLQKKILERERSFGMAPILQAFTGHIPKALIDKNKNLKYIQTTDWAGMPGTYFLDPKDSLFTVLGKRFIEIQTNLYGTDHLYDADCFNEVNPPTNDTSFISEVSKTVYASMTSADPNATWVMQGWFLFWQKNFWKEPQARALLDPVPHQNLLLLDLYGEKHTVWDKTKSFYGKPWVWNIICNNGQKVNLSGDLQIMNDNLQEALRHPDNSNLKGIGVMMEGFGFNPVVQDLIGHLTWKTDSLDIKKWIQSYATKRYGKENAIAISAWDDLLESVYSRNILGESAICYPPGTLQPKITKETPYGMDYPVQPLFSAGKKLLSVSNELESLPSFQFDLVHIFREILSVKANLLLSKSFNALEEKNNTTFSKYMSEYLILLKDLDELLASNEFFLLGKWNQNARNLGQTKEESDYYEMNARSILTLWQPSTKTHLRDYASRQWNGLVGDFYFHRWQRFKEEGEKSISDNKKIDYQKLNSELKAWELKWIQSTNKYPSKPKGNAVEICKKLKTKYNL